MTVFHTIPPVFDGRSKVLILGSFPSVKSRESAFFYGHPQNRFWRVLSALLGCDAPESTDEKRQMLLENRIALWDVIASCEIAGSSDASIRNAVPNDLRVITSVSNISAVFTNGGTADALYRKYCLESTGISAVKLPSTSPANAGASLPVLIAKWRVILDSLG